MSNKIPIVFHNDLSYDYHFIIKELAKELKGQFECLRKDSEFTDVLEFIDSARFMSSSFSNLVVDNLVEGIHKIKCKACNYFLNMKVSITIQ